MANLLDPGAPNPRLLLCLSRSICPSPSMFFFCAPWEGGGVLAPGRRSQGRERASNIYAFTDLVFTRNISQVQHRLDYLGLGLSVKSENREERSKGRLTTTSSHSQERGPPRYSAKEWQPKTSRFSTGPPSVLKASYIPKAKSKKHLIEDRML